MEATEIDGAVLLDATASGTRAMDDGICTPECRLRGQRGAVGEITRQDGKGFLAQGSGGLRGMREADDCVVGTGQLTGNAQSSETATRDDDLAHRANWFAGSGRRFLMTCILTSGEEESAAARGDFR
jgi:hypothetical protein